MLCLFFIFLDLNPSGMTQSFAPNFPPSKTGHYSERTNYNIYDNFIFLLTFYKLCCYTGSFLELVFFETVITLLLPKL